MAIIGDQVTAEVEAMRPLNNPMAQLRKMRELEWRIRRLTTGRDVLVRQALACGHSQRQVGIAAGLSNSRIHEIKMKGAVS